MKLVSFTERGRSGSSVAEQCAGERSHAYTIQSYSISHTFIHYTRSVASWLCLSHRMCSAYEVDLVSKNVLTVCVLRYRSGF